LVKLKQRFFLPGPKPPLSGADRMMFPVGLTQGREDAGAQRRSEFGGKDATGGGFLKRRGGLRSRLGLRLRAELNAEKRGVRVITKIVFFETEKIVIFEKS
jgi:hypothetical protein